MRYKEAGVDLDKQREIHKAAGTILGGLKGAYVNWIGGNLRDLALHVDGVGTKTIWLQEADKMEVAGWDCVMVNVNDVVCDGFKPLAVVDYIALRPGLEDLAVDVLRGVEEAARRVGAVVLGGETAILPDLINGVDVVCTVAASRYAETAAVKPGDFIVGLESTGPHANGYSLLRRLFKLDETLCGDRVSELFLRPVADYSPVLELMKSGIIKSAAHITGGSFRKIRRVLGNLGAELAFKLPCWAREVAKRVAPEEAYGVFNMGIGMVLFTEDKEGALRELERLGLPAKLIGVVKSDGPVVVNGVVLS